MKRLVLWSSLLPLGALLACSSSNDDGKGKSGGGAASGAGGGGVLFGSGGQGASAGSGAGAVAGNGSLADGGLADLRNAACAKDSAATEALPSVIEFVIDTSGSMNDKAPGTNQSKWTVTRNALRTAMDALPPTTAVGALYFPAMDTTASTPAGDMTDPPRDPSACVNMSGDVPIAPLGAAGSMQRTAITDSLNAARPAGGTPTDDAYVLATTALKAATFPGNRYLVLITDGQPTFLSGCRGTGNTSDAVDPRPIIADVTTAMSAGLKTFIIGSPGSEQVGVPIFADARTWLSMAAQAGGTATPGCNNNGPNFCHFDMTQTTNFAMALQTALTQIVGAVLSCEYPLPAPPSGSQIDPSKVNVVLSLPGKAPTLISQAPPGACTTGWQYSADGANIDFCPDTCTELKTAVTPTLEILFGCTTQVGPVN